MNSHSKPASFEKMFTPEDLTIDSIPQLFRFLPALIFMALCAPFLITAYSIGWTSDVIGWLD